MEHIILELSYLLLDVSGTFGKVLGSNRSSKILELAMIGVLVSVVISFALIAMLCFLNYDPFSFVLPETDDHALKILSWLLRFVGFNGAAYFGWLQLATIFVGTIFGLKIVNETLRCQNKWTNRIINGRSVKDAAERYFMYVRKRKTSGNRTVPLISMHSILAIHREVRILILTCNEVIYVLLPVLLLTGEYILVVCIYASIRMRDTIPMPFYLALPCLSCFVLLLIMVLFPTASDIYEDSLAFLKAMRLIPGRNRYWRRAWKAERAISVSMGGLFVAKRSTKSTFLVQCIDNTINALLAT
jgi:hypothetical protein